MIDKEDLCRRIMAMPWYDLTQVELAVKRAEPEGVTAWKTYVAARRELRRTTDETKKKKLLEIISSIGREYDFR